MVAFSRVAVLTKRPYFLNPDTEVCSPRGDALFIALWTKDRSVGILVSCYTFNLALLPPGILEENSGWVWLLSHCQSPYILRPRQGLFFLCQTVVLDEGTSCALHGVQQSSRHCMLLFWSVCCPWLLPHLTLVRGKHSTCLSSVTITQNIEHDSMTYSFVGS